jgi:hypothetical protein
MSFKHAIGLSTLKEGFTIPKDFWQWIAAPEKGKKKTIVLTFDGKQINATLRRINNDYGHVQVKYDNPAGMEFRQWLAHVFIATQDKLCGEYFEISKVDSDKYLVKPFPIEKDLTKVLKISKWLFHKNADKLFEEDSILREINAVIRGIEINDSEGQSYYNKVFNTSFKNWGWEAEKRVTTELGLKCDFMKSKVCVEVEFGNARSYYQDYIKFLIVPTIFFAKHLCKVGQSRAQTKGGKYYSGMIDFEKVYREFKYVKEILSMPIAIAGIGPIEEKLQGS